MKSFALKLLLLITLLIVSSGDLSAQVNWTKYPGNPVLSGQPGTWYAYLSMCSVLYNPDSSRYEMWFTSGAQASFPYTIGYAWSDDGISWNVHTSNPALTSTPGSWDAYMVFDPLVIRENGQYKMWYAGIETTALLTKIGYATSTDGINWQKDTLNNPVLLAGTASWESAAVSHPFVLPSSNGYKMWYSGSSVGASQTAFGYATSPDGINWQKDTMNNPVLLAGEIGQWDRVVYGPEILYRENLYYMYYTGQNNLYQSDKVGLATSPDGIHNWYKHGPVLQPTPGQWDGSRTIVGCVFMEDDTLKMYYAGSSGSNWEIGLATSPFVPVSVEQETIQPTEFRLSQNYPNPFNPSTKIKYSIPQSSNVVIKVFDILGNEIETLVSEENPAGTYELSWNAFNLPSGVYFYQIRAGEYISTKKMLLIK